MYLERGEVTRGLEQRAVRCALVLCAVAHACGVLQLAAQATGVPPGRPVPLLAPVRPAGDDTESALRLYVVTENDTPLAMAEVTVSFGRLRASGRTDSAGVFRTDRLIAGDWHARVRRVGYEEALVDVHLGAGENVYTITVTPAATTLEDVNVTGTRRHSTRLDEFERRRAQGMPSAVVTRAEIEKRNPLQISQMLRGLPGVSMGDENGVRVPIASRSSVPRFGQAMVACPMRVILDGMPMPRPSSIDDIMPMDVHGIEVYYGSARLPSQLANMRPDNWCGLVLVWTRDR